MPKPTVWAEDIDQILRVISEEQAQLLQLVEEQHASFSMSVQLAFARMERSDLLSRGGFGKRGRALCATSPCDLCIAEGNDDDTQEVFQDVPDQTDMLSCDDLAAHQHSSSLRKIDSTFSVPSPSRAKSKKSANSKPTAEDLLGLDNFIDRSKAWTDLLAGMLVLINSFVMLVELEVEGRAVGALIGMGEGPTLNDVSPLFRTLDAIFVFVFLAELLLRIFMEKLQFVRDVANWFDTLLVIAGLVDMFVILPMSDGAEGQNIVMLRMVRVLKCVRAIRLVRTFRFFRGLRLLVKACYCFLPSLGWSMVLLLVFMWMGTLVLGNLLQDFITDPLNNFDDRVWIWNRYGTAYRAMYTLYEITFAGNWPTSARPVLEKVNQAYVIFFLIYITIIVFAAIRVISAVFLKDTLEAARNDDETLVIERLRNKQKYVQKLQEVFHAIGGSVDGLITEERLASILESPKALAYFQTLDLDVTETSALFSLLDNGDGEITQEEFIDGVLRCKGPARAIDQVALRADLKQMDAKISQREAGDQAGAMAFAKWEDHCLTSQENLRTSAKVELCPSLNTPQKFASQAADAKRGNDAPLLHGGSDQAFHSMPSRGDFCTGVVSELRSSIPMALYLSILIPIRTVLCERFAQARLRNLILAGNAALPEVLRLLRAGAEPTRQNLSCFVNEQGDAKRARIEVGPNASPGARRLSCSGTPLHWVCHAASRVPDNCRIHYVEITRYLCDAVPVSLFLMDDNKRTPLEVLLNRCEGDAGRLACTNCGKIGHVSKECTQEESTYRTDALAALVAGFGKALVQYPLMAASAMAGPGLNLYLLQAPDINGGGWCGMSEALCARLSQLRCRGNPRSQFAAVELGWGPGPKEPRNRWGGTVTRSEGFLAPLELRAE
ncbi:Scn11a [Symbiodinium sp. KB8]|nr:Scn11a [Symbiodinium sp. KB8]